MADRWNVRERLGIARGKLRTYEGRLKELEGRLKVLRGKTEQASGRAKLQLRRAERDIRSAIESTLGRLNAALDVVEPRARQVLARTGALARGVRAGVKAGAETYRRGAKKAKKT